MPKNQRPWTVIGHGPIEKIDDNLWAVSGKSPAGPIQRRMCIVRRSDGRLVFFHAVPLEEKVLAEVTAWGKPAFLVVGHDQHAVDAPAFAKRLGVKIFGPRKNDAKLRGKVDLAGHLEDLPVDPTLSFETLSGTRTGEPVLLVRSAGGQRVSLLFCDAIQNNQRETTGPILGLLGFAGGVKVPPVFKLFFMTDRAELKADLEKLAALPGLMRLVPCHGDVVSTDAAGALRTAAARL